MQHIGQIEGTYHLDLAHSAIGFTVRHAGLTNVRGTFDSFHGYAIVDAGQPDDSALMVSIATASINTFAPDRDAHLRTADFFDAARFPAITFVATSFELLDEATVRIGGDLTIKDVTRALSLDLFHTGSAKDPFGNERVGFEGATRISRKDFGLTWNTALETGGWLVGDEISIEIDASAIKQLSEVPVEGETKLAGGADGYQVPAVIAPEQEQEFEARQDARPRRAMLEADEQVGSSDSETTNSAAASAPSRPSRALVDSPSDVERDPQPEKDERTNRGGWRALLRRG